MSRDFEKGKIHGIVGNNGSGKTVLMKCICGFLLPTEGKVIVNGKQVGKDVDFPGDLGIIIETPGFLPNITCLLYTSESDLEKKDYEELMELLDVLLKQEDEA